MSRRRLAIVLLASCLAGSIAASRSASSDTQAYLFKEPSLSARAAVILDASSGKILYSKNAFEMLPPASTTKVMTVVVALEHLKYEDRVVVSQSAYNVSPSKAGLTVGASYSVSDLITATLVSSSNDAAVALAEAVSGDEESFAKLMNEKARQLGLMRTHFVNASGLPDKRREQYSTAYDLARLMFYAAKDPRIDTLMGIVTTTIRGSDNKVLPLHAHNKMLWKTPCFVKGKTGWTYAARHTFVGTDYDSRKRITFAMLASEAPWTDIKRLANFGLLVGQFR